MIEAILLILIPFAITAFWVSNLRAREHATRIGNNLCDRRQYQFLDATVALSRMAIANTDTGLRLVRVYSFDYAKGGVGRYKGWVMLKGNILDAYSIGDDSE